MQILCMKSMVAHMDFLDNHLQGFQALESRSLLNSSGLAIPTVSIYTQSCALQAIALDPMLARPSSSPTFSPPPIHRPNPNLPTHPSIHPNADLPRHNKQTERSSGYSFQDPQFHPRPLQHRDWSLWRGIVSQRYEYRSLDHNDAILHNSLLFSEPRWRFSREISAFPPLVWKIQRRILSFVTAGKSSVDRSCVHWIYIHTWLSASRLQPNTLPPDLYRAASPGAHSRRAQT